MGGERGEAGVRKNELRVFRWHWTRGTMGAAGLGLSSGEGAAGRRDWFSRVVGIRTLFFSSRENNRRRLRCLDGVARGYRLSGGK